MLSFARFSSLWAALGAVGDGHEAFARLVAAYDEPHRAYHTAAHIGACLRLLDDAEVATCAGRITEVLAAIWFHDAVYDTHAHDNEEQSARMMADALGAAGVAADVIARIGAHVRATKAHVPDSADGQLVIDIDLSILGESADVFGRFEEDIRREYAWVDEAAYVAGRAAVLRGFAARATIYGTPLLRDRYEARARANLAASLSRLPEKTRHA